MLASIDSVLWLAVVTLMQIQNVKEQAEVGRIQSLYFEEENSTPGTPVLKKIKSKKKPGSKWSIGNGDFLASLHLVKSSEI